MRNWYRWKNLPGKINQQLNINQREPRDRMVTGLSAFMEGTMQLIVICAWCQKYLGFTKWKGSTPPKFPVSHGICPDCQKGVEEEINNIKGGDHERERQTSIR